MGRHPYRKFYSWNSSLAYFAGLMASDGCLLNDGRHMDITSKDIEIIQNVKNIINTQAKPSLKSGGKGQKVHRLEWGDVSMYDFLLNSGITPAKSKIIKLVTIPDIFYADFLRGEFDGDGTTYGYMDPRWRSSFMYYVGFSSASLKFIHFLQTKNCKLIGVSLGSIRISTRSYQLFYAKADSQKLYNYMYYDRMCPCLSRKKTKLYQFIQKDQTDIITAINARVVKLVHTQP